MKDPSKINQEPIVKKSEAKRKQMETALQKSEQNYRVLATYHKRLNQILSNLCVNARDAIVGVGKVTIETGNVIFDEAYCIVITWVLFQESMHYLP